MHATTFKKCFFNVVTFLINKLSNPFFVSERLGSILGTKDFVRILKYPQVEATLTFISSSPKSLTTLERNHSC